MRSAAIEYPADPACVPLLIHNYGGSKSAQNDLHNVFSETGDSPENALYSVSISHMWNVDATSEG